MARTRRAGARGTRLSSGIESGVSWTTKPSGVTIDTSGINAGAGLLTLTELNRLNGATGYSIGNAAAAKLCVSGVSYWAGTTLNLHTGLTTISQIICSIVNEGVSTKPLEVRVKEINGSGVSAAIYLTMGQVGFGVSLASTIVAPGCSIAFIAFGS